MYNRQIEKLCRTRLDDVLLDEGLADRSHVETAMAESETTGRLLSQVLFEREVLDEWDLAKLIARHYSLPYINIDEYNVPVEALTLLPKEFCEEHCLVPIETFGSHVAIAVCELPSVEVLKQLAHLLRTTPFMYVALRSAIGRAVEGMDEEAYQPRATGPMAAAGAGDPASASFEAGAAGAHEMPGITMRLGYSMHARSGEHTVPLQSLSALPSRPAASAAPAAEAPAPAATPAVAESGEAGKSPAAWQEIFDLGDEAASG